MYKTNFELKFTVNFSSQKKWDDQSVAPMKVQPFYKKVYHSFIEGFGI